MPVKGVAPRRGGEGVLGGSYPSEVDNDDDTSEDNRRHNLRPRRRTSARYMDEEGEEDLLESDLEGEGMTGGTSAGAGGESGGEKKRVGRPIAYRGDPNSPHLTEEERRRIKRRIANRESARRVRQKRQDVMEELQMKINALQSQNQRLMARVGEVEAHKGMLTGQVAALRNKWSSATNDNVRLQAELGTLRKTLQMQQANLDLLQRGSVGGSLAAGPAAHAPGTPTAADIFGNIAAFYGLPSSGAAGNPGAAAAAVASASAPAGVPAPPGPSGGGGGGISAFSNNGPSAFSPIQPLHSAGMSAVNAFGAQRQSSDAWNFLHAASRMGSGSLAALGTFGSGQLTEGLGLAGAGIGSSSALNIAALNPAGSGRLPDLAPLNPSGSGRLLDLPPLGSGRLPEAIGQFSSGQPTISRPTPLLASGAPPFAREPQQPSAAAAAAEAMAARGSSTADPPLHSQGPSPNRESRGIAAAEDPPAVAGSGPPDLEAEEKPPAPSNRHPSSQVDASNRVISPGPALVAAAGLPQPSMEEISALMFLKSSSTELPPRAAAATGGHETG